MNKHELVVIGGSAGGIQAAACAQRLHGLQDVLVIRREEMAMVPCGIPYIYGTLGSVEKNAMPNSLLENAMLRIGEAVSVGRDEKIIEMADGDVIGYNKLILATGSEPLRPTIGGLDNGNVFFVNKDANHLQKLAEAMVGAKQVVVIGGGFIGIEFADECRKRGLQVTVVELLNHCLQLVCPLDMCIRVEDNLKARGVNAITGTSVIAICGNSHVQSVKLKDGREIACDVVIVGIGVLPNVTLAREAGLAIGPTGGIKVDEFQRTTDPDILV